MSGPLSLEGSIRTCKVDQGWANKIQTDRFFNPNLMMCPVWNGRDLTGRKVCPDSFMTKREGCNSAEDRITVENSLRPQYMEYVTLDAAGIQGAFYNNGQQYENDLTRGGMTRNQALQNAYNYTGNYGLDFGASVFPGCASYPYARSMSMSAEGQRGMQMMKEGYQSSNNRRASGFGKAGYAYS